MKILREGNKIVTVDEMERGEIGVIHKWNIGEFEGTFVLKTYRELVEIGGIHIWSALDLIKHSKNNLIKILPPGTLLEI